MPPAEEMSAPAEEGALDSADESAECVETPEPTTNPEVTKMIEPHAPHHPVTTWKDFLLHIAVVSIGLLLAIGLEQTVEFFHHRHQVAEVRRELANEKVINLRRFAIETEEFYRFIPILKKNLAIYQYLKKHPGAAPETWPGKLSWSGLSIGYVDSVWKTAQQSNVLQYMPDVEVRRYVSFYGRLDRLGDLNGVLSDLRNEATKISIQEPDPSKLTPAQIDAQIERTTDLIMATRKAGNAQRVAAIEFPELTPSPTGEDIAAINNVQPVKEDAEKVIDEHRRMLDADKGVGEEGSATGK